LEKGARRLLKVWGNRLARKVGEGGGVLFAAPLFVGANIKHKVRRDAKRKPKSQGC